jgi:hypothetical protein
LRINRLVVFGVVALDIGMAPQSATLSHDITPPPRIVNTAERIYARAGWQTVETFARKSLPTALMRRDLTLNSPAACSARTG